MDIYLRDRDALGVLASFVEGTQLPAFPSDVLLPPDLLRDLKASSALGIPERVQYDLEHLGEPEELVSSSFETAVEHGKANVLHLLWESFRAADNLEKHELFGYLSQAAERGHAEVIRFLARTAGLHSDYAPSEVKGKTLLRRTLKPGDAETLRVLAREYGLGPKDAIGDAITGLNDSTMKDAPLVVVTQQGNADAVKVLVEEYRLRRGVPRSAGYVAFLEAVATGRLDIVRILVEEYGLTREDIRSSNTECATTAIRNCRLQVLKYLVETFRLEKEDLQGCNNYALRVSVKLGSFDMLNYLHSLGFDSENARDADCEAVKLAVYNDDPEMLRFLAQKFGLDAEDARSEDNYALVEAASNGYYECLEVLATHFKLSREDAACQNNTALRMAARNGHDECLRILATRFGLSKEDASARHHEALRHAARNGYWEVLQVLSVHYDLGEGDVRDCDLAPLRDAIRGGYADVLEVLSEDYGLGGEQKDTRQLVFCELDKVSCKRKHTLKQVLESHYDIVA